MDAGVVGVVEEVLLDEEVDEEEDRLEKNPKPEDSCARSLPLPKSTLLLPLLPLLALLPSLPWSVR